MKNICLMILVIAILSCTLTTSCNNQHDVQSGNNSGLSSDSVISLAREAYLFGFPVVLMHETIRGFTM